MTLVRCLRVASLTEGVSFLALLLVAMPLKYAWGRDAAVTWTGWAHGLLFILLGALLLAAMRWAALPFKIALIVGIAALLPGGPFYADRFLKRHERSLPGAGEDRRA